MSRWQTKTLGQLCQLISGQHVEARNYNTECRGVGYLTGPSDFGSVSPFISKWTESPKVRAQSGDILITVKGSGVGSINLLDQDNIAISRQLMAVRTMGADARFVHAFLASKFEYFQSLATGAAIPGLSRDQILGIEIKIPPPAEQKRIVAILDEVFERIAEAVANAQKNLANARELFVSYVADVFGKGGAKWQESTIGTDVDILTGFAFRSQNYTSDLNGIPMLRGDNIVQGKLRWDDVKRWPRSDYEIYNKYRLEEGDIVLAMDRTWINAGIKFARISHEDVPALLVQRVARMRCKSTLSNGFLFHLLGSNIFEKYVLDSQTGLGVPHISGGQIQAFRFRRPNIHAQRQIILDMDAMRANCERLVAKYERQLELLGELRQSILQKAFSGELTAQSARLLAEAAA